MKDWKSVVYKTIRFAGIVLIAASISFGLVMYYYAHGLSAQYEELSVEYGRLKELVDLVDKGASLQSKYNLRYEYHKVDSALRIQGPWNCLIYSPYDNSTLYLTLSITTFLSESYVSVSVQMGNAFDVETNETAPVIWSANATASSIYYVPLASEGWYTISLVGPIEKHLDASGIVVGQTYRWFEDVDCGMSIRMIYEREYSPFATKPC